MSELSVKHLLGVKYLNLQDIELIFKTADNFKEIINRPIKKVPSLRDVTIANLFFETSTRTKLSFELAQKRLSADIINFSSSHSSVKKGETLIDTVNNILENGTEGDLQLKEYNKFADDPNKGIKQLKKYLMSTVEYSL